MAGKRDAAIGQICFQFREHVNAGRPRLLARSAGRRKRLYHTDFNGTGPAASDVDLDAPRRRMYKKLEFVFIKYGGLMILDSLRFLCQIICNLTVVCLKSRIK